LLEGRSPDNLKTAVYLHPRMQELALPVTPAEMKTIWLPCQTGLHKICNYVNYQKIDDQ
jgi:hypothetical protein